MNASGSDASHCCHWIHNSKFQFIKAKASALHISHDKSPVTEYHLQVACIKALKTYASKCNITLQKLCFMLELSVSEELFLSLWVSVHFLSYSFVIFLGQSCHSGIYLCGGDTICTNTDLTSEVTPTPWHLFI